MQINSIVSEKELRQQVIELMKLGNWQFYFTWLSIHSPAGFPDICAAKTPRLVFAELKTELGKVTAAQQKWLDILATVPGVEVYLWRPSEFEDIKKVLLG